MAVTKRVTERIASELKRYQGILADAKDRDISESDTVVIIVDLLADVLGYKKYLEITTEYSIRGTYVDLAVKVGDEVRFLVEAKAIGLSLKESHVKQAIDYAANHGIEWVALTNGVLWQVYKVHFRQPIDKTLVLELDLLQSSPRNREVLGCLGNLSREGFTQSSMKAFFQERKATSKFSIAALLMSESVLGALRRELRKVAPSIRFTEEQLRTMLADDVIKRDLVDGDDAKEAGDFVRRSLKSAARAKAKAKERAEVSGAECENHSGRDDPLGGTQT